MPTLLKTHFGELIKGFRLAIPIENFATILLRYLIFSCKTSQFPKLVVNLLDSVLLQE